jgi:hypothetical protein
LKDVLLPAILRITDQAGSHRLMRLYELNRVFIQPHSHRIAML